MPEGGVSPSIDDLNFLSFILGNLIGMAVKYKGKILIDLTTP